MSLIETIGIAVGLAMDAFSVCIAAGLVIERPNFGHYFRLSFHFGLFQFVMPIIGYYGGIFIGEYISAYDHWIAFVLLGWIGAKMIRESYAKAEGFRADPSRGRRLIVLSFATSIDALAVGLSLGILGKPVFWPSVVIGIVCAAFSAAGLALGRKAGAFLGRRVERLGGAILIAIGIKIVVEHLWL